MLFGWFNPKAGLSWISLPSLHQTSSTVNSTSTILKAHNPTPWFNSRKQSHISRLICAKDFAKERMSEDLELQMPLKNRGEADASHPPSRAVETLESLLEDSRVEPKRTGALRFTVDVPLAPPPKINVDARPSARWRTPEFLFYGIMFILVVPWMIWKPIDLSSGWSLCF